MTPYLDSVVCLLAIIIMQVYKDKEEVGQKKHRLYSQKGPRNDVETKVCAEKDKEVKEKFGLPGTNADERYSQGKTQTC